MSLLGFRRWLGAALALGVIALSGLVARAPSGERIHVAAPAAALVLLGMAGPRRRSARPADPDVPLADARYRALFGNTPVQILEEDFTAVDEAFARLRAEGITNLMAHLAAHPSLPRELLGLVRLRNANRPALAAAGFASREEMITRFSELGVAPYLEVFDYQLERLWTGRQLFEEEFRYLDAKGQERACLMLCQVNDRDGSPDLSRVALVLLDITTARRTVEAQMENQEVLRQILARANILMWWARVRREGSHFRWKINVPTQSFDSPLLQLATARDRGGLWDVEHAPDLPETSRRAEEALRNGLSGYQQEFRVLSPEGMHWLSEDVAIHRLSEDEWNLVGVITDVTAKREAEEARRKTQAQLQQILGQADCMLWQARVTEADGQLQWRLEAPSSGLQKRIFDSDTGIIREGIAGVATRSLYRGFIMPEQAEMDARSMAALHSGAPGYEQEFRLIKDGQVFWLHERVSITPAGPGQWDLVGISIDVTERHEAEEERKKSQAQLRQILTRADCMLWQARVTESDSQFIWEFEIPPSGLQKRIFGGNAGVAHKGVSGIKAKSLYGDFIVPEQAEMDACGLGALRSGAPGYEQEYRLIRGNQTFWLHERVSITSVQSGQWDLVGITIDVTAQHEAEEARKKSQDQLRQILTRADCILWQANIVREGDGVRWRNFEMPSSVLYQRLFGADRPTSGTGLWLLTDTPELPEMNRRSTEAILSGAPGYEQEFPVLRPEKTLWLHEQVSITAVGPDEWNLVGVLMDVTARRQAEEARRTVEAHLQQILSRVDCVLWQARVTDNHGRFEWVFDLPPSRLQRQIFGDKAVTGEIDLYDKLAVPELPEMYVRSAAALRGGAPGYEQEFRVIKPDRTYWLHEQVSITADRPGQWRLFGVMLDVTALKEAEEARKRSEAQVEQILSRTDCMLWQARVTEVNNRMYWKFTAPPSGLQHRIFGAEGVIQREGVNGDPTNDLYIGLERPERSETEARCTAALHGGASGYEQEFRLIKDGQTFWLHERVSITPIGPGEWELGGITIDVTARREAEEARKESEAQLHQLLMRADCMLWQARVVENAAAALDWHLFIPRSQLYRTLFGADPEEHPNLMWSELNVPELAEMNARSSDAIHRGLPGYEQEFRAQREGRWYWLHEQVSITRGGPGEWSIVGVVTDISARRAAELALAAEKERLAVTLRAMTEGVITTDVQGVVQYVNRAAAELVECEEAAAVGRPLGEVCHLREGRVTEVTALPFARVLQEDCMVNLPPHTRLVSRDGPERHVEGCCIPIHAADSALIGSVLVFRDVTEREQLEQEIARASKLESVGILAGGIAHDFNNILTVVIGNITLALLDASELAKVEYYLRETERAALRARDLTQQLLTFAKGGEPIRTAVRLPEIIKEVAEFALHGSRVKCEFDFPADLWPADADKGQISQVVQNLVINSIQAMPEGGIIRLSARNETPTGQSRPPFHPGDYVRISVADTGTGIKAEHLAKVFDPYFSTKQQGSGLGLATVYSIVKRHQGHIEVESELGRGATFHLWLPALREQQLDLPARSAAAPGPMQGRVLLMDDEETIREMARFLLNRLGFEVELAADGAEAVRQYQVAQAGGRPFDLVVMDLTVPAGMGGQEALARLRQIDPAVRAIVSSGYSIDPVLANYRAHGFRGMVAKPYQLDDLTRALREALAGDPTTPSRSPTG